MLLVHSSAPSEQHAQHPSIPCDRGKYHGERKKKRSKNPKPKNPQTSTSFFYASQCCSLQIDHLASHDMMWGHQSHLRCSCSDIQLPMQWTLGVSKRTEFRKSPCVRSYFHKGDALIPSSHFYKHHHTHFFFSNWNICVGKNIQSMLKKWDRSAYSLPF